MWEVTGRELGFPVPSGYRVLEDTDVVVVVNPFGHQIFVGSATSTTRDALRAAIERDLSGRPDPTMPNTGAKRSSRGRLKSSDVERNRPDHE